MPQHERLSRQTISDGVSDLGWRFALGAVRTHVRVGSLAQAVQVAARAVTACGPEDDARLRADLRADGVVLTLQARDTAWTDARDIELAGAISAAVAGLGLVTEAGGPLRSVQVMEVGIDALDIPAIRPFWKALLGYVDEPGSSGPQDPIVDPLGQSPAIWFQQMDAPRPQRNRIHFDVAVPHDEAETRIAAAVSAGGTLLGDFAAPAFWVLADAEGNEACITTWQGRD